MFDARTQHNHRTPDDAAARIAEAARRHALLTRAAADQAITALQDWQAAIVELQTLASQHTPGSDNARPHALSRATQRLAQSMQSLDALISRPSHGGEA